MYARVASWDGGDAEAIRASAEGIQSRSAEGPPEGVPAVGFLLLIDPDNGRSIGISLYATEEDMHTGDATLNEMSPPGDGMGTRQPVEFYEVGVDMRV
ncbi:MAG TPA: hypothetical protein VNA28_11815 [Solirubrobacteraceae bacterium]|nr:hypothetical protein [Solirubrobacteraceae bacterium]